MQIKAPMTNCSSEQVTARKTLEDIGHTQNLAITKEADPSAPNCKVCSGLSGLQACLACNNGTVHNLMAR